METTVGFVNVRTTNFGNIKATVNKTNKIGRTALKVGRIGAARKTNSEAFEI